MYQFWERQKQSNQFDTPLVSVVIPAYNEELLIGNTLKSLMRQNFSGEFEVIVVDNNSSDRTAQLASRLGAKIVFEPRRGVCAARQAGTLAALGQIIVSTDADTYFSPDWLSKIYLEFTNNPKLVAVVGSCEFVDAPSWGKIFTKTTFGLIHKIYKATGKVKYLAACNAAFRKSAWSGYNVALTQGGDELDLLKQLQAKGPIKYLPHNHVFTSSRRLRKGLFYNLFVTFLLYYCLDYFIGRRIGRSFTGSYAAIREQKPKNNFGWSFGTPLVAVLIIFFSFSVPRASAASVARKTGSRIAHMEDRIDVKFTSIKDRVRQWK
jgi:glycosyltransferase involved in cell wall biosynthesis